MLNNQQYHQIGLITSTPVDLKSENYPFVGDVIDQLKIGRTAFYRYFLPDRIKQLRAEHADSIQT